MERSRRPQRYVDVVKESLEPRSRWSRDDSQPFLRVNADIQAIELKHNNKQKLEHDVLQKKAQLEELQHKHAHNSELRDAKLHTPAPVGNAPVGAGVQQQQPGAPLAPAGGLATGTGHGLAGNTAI